MISSYHRNLPEIEHVGHFIRRDSLLESSSLIAINATIGVLDIVEYLKFSDQ